MIFGEEIKADLTRLNRLFGETLMEVQNGSTSKSQKFATVITCMETIITCKKWYAVRLYMEEDHRNLSNAWIHLRDRFLCITQHKTLVGAEEKVAEYHQQLEDGDYKNLFNNYDRFEMNTWFSNKSVKFREIIFTKIVPADCAKNPDAYLKRGDIVQRDLHNVANHDGIYIGNGKVIHISGEHKTTSKACEGNLFGDFVKNSTDAIRVLLPRVRFRTPEEIAKQAEDYRDAKFGKGLYNILMKNCQHFAFLCAFGIEYSNDVEELLLFSSIMTYCSLVVIVLTLKQTILKRG